MMTPRNHARRRTWLLAVAAFLPLIGCGKNFYMSESDARTLAFTLQTAATANELFADLPNGQNRTPSIQVLFDNSSGTPRISNTGYLLTTIRGLGDLQGFEQNQGQINLDRLSTQLESQLDDWVAQRVVLFSAAGGSQVKITRLDSVSARFGQTPIIFVYDAQHSRISFNCTAAVTIAGSINVNILSGVGGFVAGIFGQNPNGDYQLTIGLQEMPIHGWLALSNPFSDAAQVQLHIDAPTTAGAMTINIIGTGQSQIRDGITAVFTRQLSSPIDASYLLAFDNFSVSDLKIDPASQTLTSVYHPIPYPAVPSFHLVARKSDGKLYYSRKQSSSWSDFSAVPLPGNVAGDPALVASGPGQLEMAVVGSDGSLYYTDWRDGAWGNAFRSQVPQTAIPARRPIPPIAGGNGGRIINPSFDTNTRPALIATAPGQVEIIARDTLGSLWHLRRVNGQWQQAIRFGHQNDQATRPLRDPVAVWSGNQIELFYVDSQNRLFVQPFSLDSATWGAQLLVPSQGTNYAPAVAACGDGRLDLVYLRPDGSPYHRVLNVGADGSLAFGAERFVGGNLNAGPELVCSGYQQVELLGRGNDNAFYYNHYTGPASPQGVIGGRQVNPGWQGWVQQNSAFFAFPFYGGSIGAAMAVASTRSGDVELVTPVNGTGDLPLYENSFPSSRFGHSDWNAVEWRGFQLINVGQNIGGPRFVGRPALAVSDRQLELQLAGNSGAQVVAVSEGFSPPAQGSAAAGPLLSSGPGALHAFMIGSDGGIMDFPFVNSTQLPTRSLPWTGTPITSLTATSNNGGEMDVVGVGRDETLYHWRSLNGHWQPGAALPFTFTVTIPSPHPQPPGSHPVQPPAHPPGAFQRDMAPSLVLVAQPPGSPAPHPPAPHPPRPVHTQTKIVAGKVVSPPILVDTGAGQLELVANGGPTDYGDHSLYRWRFANGSWTAAQQVTTSFTVSTRRFAQSMASSWGDGTVDLVVVNDANGAMLNTRLLPLPPPATIIAGGAHPDPRGGSVATWPLLTSGISSDRRFMDISGNTTAAPALIAFSPTRLQLLATGTDGYLYDNQTQTTRVQPNPVLGNRPGLPEWGWRGFQPLTNVPVSLGSTAKIADREFAVAVKARDGRVMLNRFQGWRWSDFFAASTSAASSSQTPALTVH